jgi:hypothetical protein
LSEGAGVHLSGFAARRKRGFNAVRYAFLNQ